MIRERERSIIEDMLVGPIFFSLDRLSLSTFSTITPRWPHLPDFWISWGPHLYDIQIWAVSMFFCLLLSCAHTYWPKSRGYSHGISGSKSITLYHILCAFHALSTLQFTLYLTKLHLHLWYLIIFYELLTRQEEAAREQWRAWSPSCTTPGSAPAPTVSGLLSTSKVSTCWDFGVCLVASWLCYALLRPNRASGKIREPMASSCYVLS